MSTIGLLIKPASSSCNMACKYCFYHDEAQNRTTANYGIMPKETRNSLLQKIFAAGFESIDLMFQGGEPTLAGLDFYRELTERVKQYNIHNIPVRYAIQTNGYALTEEWAKFLAEHRFLVGISLDGTKEIHNLNRLDAKGKDTHKRVMGGIKLLQKHQVEFNILSVVTKSFARHIDSIWRFYKENGFSYLQFIPCLDPLEKERGKEKYSLTPVEYGAFLKKVFDYLYADIMAGQHTYVRYFDELMFLVTGAGCPSCTMSGQCRNQMVMEADGSVYPCDFYVLDQYRIGNIMTDSLEELIKRGEESSFIAESMIQKESCKICRWYSWCRGGCRRDWENGSNYFCDSYQILFEYAGERLAQLGKYIRRGNQY